MMLIERGNYGVVDLDKGLSEYRGVSVIDDQSRNRD
jgi:hypothetical protein